MMLPTSRSIRLLVGTIGVLALIWLAGLHWPLPQALSWWLLGLIGVLMLAGALTDLLVLRRAPAPVLTRQLPPALTAGLPTSVHLHLRLSAPARLLLVDHHPGDDDSLLMPDDLGHCAAGEHQFEYRYRPARRGAARFGPTDLWQRGPLGLLERRHRLATDQTLPVYPDYLGLVSTLEGSGQQQRPQGRPQRRHSGDGQEFHQLMEAEPGTPLRQIDWRATSRYGQLIRRDYMPEAGRPLLIVLDTSLRMAAGPTPGALLDAALNGALRLAWHQLQQRQRVGALVVQADRSRWLAPRGHAHAFFPLMQQLHDLQPGEHELDPILIAERLGRHWPREAQVLLITRILPDDRQELMHLRRSLGPHRPLVIADMLLPEETPRPIQPEDSPDQVMEEAGRRLDWQRRDALRHELARAGVTLLSCTERSLGIQLVDAFR